MSSPTPSLRRSRPAHVLLWLGVLALLLGSLSLHCRTLAAAGSDPSVLEVCSAAGLLRLDAVTLEPLPAGDDSGARLSGCPHCTPGAMPVVLFAALVLAFSIGAGQRTATPPLYLRLRVADDPALRPIVPRGPPAAA